MLKQLNPLEIDKIVLYDDVSHSYGLRTFPGKQFKSVTAIAATRMPPFDKTVISAKLAASSKGKYAGKSAQEIRKLWADLASLGTALHANIEAYYNGGAMPDHLGFRRAAAVLKDVLLLRPYRTELQMAAANGVAGTADMIFTTLGKLPQDGITIVDWKRTDEAPVDCRYDKCRRELQHLPAGKFWKFALQVNLYAHLLWDTCRLPTIRMLLVLLHPNGSGYDILNVPLMPEARTIYCTC